MNESLFSISYELFPDVDTALSASGYTRDQVVLIPMIRTTGCAIVKIKDDECQCAALGRDQGPGTCSQDAFNYKPDRAVDSVFWPYLFPKYREDIPIPWLEGRTP